MFLGFFMIPEYLGYNNFLWVSCGSNVSDKNSFLSDESKEDRASLSSNGQEKNTDINKAAFSFGTHFDVEAGKRRLLLDQVKGWLVDVKDNYLEQWAFFRTLTIPQLVQYRSVALLFEIKCSFNFVKNIDFIYVDAISRFLLNSHTEKHSIFIDNFLDEIEALLVDKEVSFKDNPSVINFRNLFYLLDFQGIGIKDKLISDVLPENEERGFTLDPLFAHLDFFTTLLLEKAHGVIEVVTKIKEILSVNRSNDKKNGEFDHLVKRFLSLFDCFDKKITDMRQIIISFDDERCLLNHEPSDFLPEGVAGWCYEVRLIADKVHEILRKNTEIENYLADEQDEIKNVFLELNSNLKDLNALLFFLHSSHFKEGLSNAKIIPGKKEVFIENLKKWLDETKRNSPENWGLCKILTPFQLAQFRVIKTFFECRSQFEENLTLVNVMVVNFIEIFKSSLVDEKLDMMERIMIHVRGFWKGKEDDFIRSPFVCELKNLEDILKSDWIDLEKMVIRDYVAEYCSYLGSEEAPITVQPILFYINSLTTLISEFVAIVSLQADALTKIKSTIKDQTINKSIDVYKNKITSVNTTNAEVKLKAKKIQIGFDESLYNSSDIFIDDVEGWFDALKVLENSLNVAIKGIVPVERVIIGRRKTPEIKKLESVLKDLKFQLVESVDVIYFTCNVNFSKSEIKIIVDGCLKENKSGFFVSKNNFVEFNVSGVKEKKKLKAPTPISKTSKKKKNKKKNTRNKNIIPSTPEVKKSVSGQQKLNQALTFKPFDEKPILPQKADYTISQQLHFAVDALPSIPGHEYLNKDIHYYASVLGSSIDLINACYAAKDLEGVAQGALYPFIRSASILTEQLLVHGAGADTLHHSHKKLLTSWPNASEFFPLDVRVALSQDMNFGAFTTRYPHQTRNRLKKMGAFLKWMLDPVSLDHDRFNEIIGHVYQFINTLNPKAELPSKFKPETFNPEDLAHKFATDPQEIGEWSSVNFLFTEISSFLEQKTTENRVNAVHLKESLHWKDASFHLASLQCAIDNLIRYPKAKFLLAQGDRILTHLQFLWEQIETANYIQKHEIEFLNHSLEGYENRKDETALSEEGWQTLEKMNISYGGQYPHRYILHKEISPESLQIKRALSWRLDLAELSFYFADIDEGMSLSGRGKKSKRVTPERVLALKRELIQMTKESLTAVKTVLSRM